MSLTQPVVSLYADLFNWKSVVTIASNVTTANANRATDRLQLQSDAFFVLLAFLGTTNYDPVAGDFIATIGAGPSGTATRTLVSNAVVPNNFEVMIKLNGDIDLMGAPMPQACIASNGYFAGNQLPYPVILPPMTTFDFTFYNVAQTILTTVDQSTVIPLSISFGLLGVFVPSINLDKYLAAWPSYGRVACQSQADTWIRNFTTIRDPAVPGLR